MSPGPAQLIERVVGAVEGVVGQADRPVLLHAPMLEGNAKRYVDECIETAWVSSAGAFVTRFEQEIAAYTGAEHAIAIVNGTAALHLALDLVGVRAGDEVLCPSLTFVATANAISHAGATPHFVEASEADLGVDVAKLGEYLEAVADRRDGGCVNRQTGRRIGAIVPVHVLGHPMRADRLADVAARWGVPIVEDAAEALGSRLGRRHAGTFGRIGVLSFNGNKIVTTGGGGMLLTDDAALAERARHLSTTAKRAHRWAFDHDQVAYNYRMPNINAALGVGQLERLDGMLKRKRELAERYAAAFGSIAGVRFIAEPAGTTSNYWLNGIRLTSRGRTRRDELLAALNDAGLQCRPLWTPMHQLPMYQSCPGMAMDVTDALADTVINLPSSAFLG